MRTWVKRTLVIASSGLLLVVGLVALTGFRGGCGMHGGHGKRDPAATAAFVTARVDDALDDVDATDEQRARIHAVKDRFLGQVQELRTGHDAVHQELFGQWKAERPDAAKLHALVDQRFEQLRALAHQAVDSGVEVHGILTPEQREKVTRKMERRMAR